VELAGLGVALDLLVKARRIEPLEPGAEARKVVGWQLGDGLFQRAARRAQ
jgi:hypothetical protein